jgi:hypothetical protein
VQSGRCSADYSDFGAVHRHQANTANYMSYQIAFAPPRPPRGIGQLISHLYPPIPRAECSAYGTVVHEGAVPVATLADNRSGQRSSNPLDYPNRRHVRHTLGQVIRHVTAAVATVFVQSGKLSAAVQLAPGGGA